MERVTGRQRLPVGPSITSGSEDEELGAGEVVEAGQGFAAVGDENVAGGVEQAENAAAGGGLRGDARTRPEAGRAAGLGHLAVGYPVHLTLPLLGKVFWRAIRVPVLASDVRVGILPGHKRDCGLPESGA
jgi:hypothetical protein